MKRSHWFALGSSLLVASIATQAFAQAPLPTPPPAPPTMRHNFPPQELDRIVSPIALYPDPLLGQILTAATFSPEIPDAARWADEHHYVPPARLPAEIAADQLPWEPSVQALLPFPNVLGMMASSMPWTEELGDAFLESPDAVMDAVQRQRRLANSYGYLRSNAHVSVVTGPYIGIVPVDPWYIPVPYYDPAIIYVRPRPGYVVAGGLYYGYGVRLTPVYAPYGWNSTRFVWGEKVLYVNNSPWRRTWTNKAVYVHPYNGVTRYQKTVVAEKHETHARTEKEREAATKSTRPHEEHKSTTSTKSSSKKK